MTHINVYGPAASGKTRNAEALRKKYNCRRIWDEGKEPPNSIPVIRCRLRTLALTQKPIIHPMFINIPIEEALR